MKLKMLAGIVLTSLLACERADTQRVDLSGTIADTWVTPLTHAPGHIARGRRVFTSRESGHCILCHSVAGLDAEFQGTVGPTLTGVADRLSPAQLRLRVIDYQKIVPGALMPSYYRLDGLNQVGDAYADSTILTAQEVEDVVAYLGSLSDDRPAL